MRICYQSAGQTMLEHEIAVQTAFQSLQTALQGVASLPDGYRVPDWLWDAKQPLLSRLLPAEQLTRYQIYHDCGKPLCRRLDSEGKQHFPNHAEVSARRWRTVTGDEATARLIERDMDAHQLKAEDLLAFAQLPEAASLWLTALAEVHANAPMFGGFESDSFKIKWKHLDRRGKALMKLW